MWPLNTYSVNCNKCEQYIATVISPCYDYVLNTAVAGHIKMRDYRTTLLGTKSLVHIYSALKGDCPIGIQIIN